MPIRVRRSDPVSTRDVGEGMCGLGAGSVGGPAREESEGWSVIAKGLGGVTPMTLVGTGTSDSVDVGEGTGGLGAGFVGGPNGGDWLVGSERAGGVMGGCVGESVKGGWVGPLSLAVVF